MEATDDIYDVIIMYVKDKIECPKCKKVFTITEYNEHVYPYRMDADTVYYAYRCHVFDRGEY